MTFNGNKEKYNEKILGARETRRAEVSAQIGGKSEKEDPYGRAHF